MTHTQRTAGGATALPIAATFIALGGRLMLSPKGKLEAGIEMGIVFAPETAPEASREAERAARAITAQLVNPRAVASLKCLVLRTGERTPGGWLVAGGLA